MPRGSRFLDEPLLMRHPDTGAERTATTKVEEVTYSADGFKPAHVLDEQDDAATRSEAGKKAARTRARNQRQAVAAGDEDGGDASGATATETTGSGTADPAE